MHSWAPGDDPQAGGPRKRLRPALKKGRQRGRRLPRWARYTLWFMGMAGVVIGGQLALHLWRSDPRDHRAMTARELELTVIDTGEQVQAAVEAYRRSPLNYFRATRGTLLLTDRRMVFLGLVPRDFVSSPDAPPAFEQREFPVDTAVTIEPGRAALVARALVISTREGETKLGIARGDWEKADSMRRTFDWRHAALFAEGRRQKAIRELTVATREAADVERRRPRYHIIRRGEALASIASLYDTTPEELRALNRIEGNRIRIGDRMLVRGALPPATPPARDTATAGE
jgi:hypothetical protein